VGRHVPRGVRGGEVTFLFWVCRGRCCMHITRLFSRDFSLTTTIVASSSRQTLRRALRPARARSSQAMAEPGNAGLPSLSVDGDEVRVKTAGRIRDYVSYVVDRLQVRFPDPSLGSADARARRRHPVAHLTRRAPPHDPPRFRARTRRSAVRDRRFHLARGHGHRHRARRPEGGRGGGDREALARRGVAPGDDDRFARRGGRRETAEKRRRRRVRREHANRRADDERKRDEKLFKNFSERAERRYPTGHRDRNRALARRARVTRGGARVPVLAGDDADGLRINGAVRSAERRPGTRTRNEKEKHRGGRGDARRESGRAAPAARAARARRREERESRPRAN
jgi:hypothetical protein